MRLKKELVLGALSLMLSAVALPSDAQDVREKQLAFPGAEGFGRYVTGGRGGKVYHVTNLNDSGEGSLRDALSKSGFKIIVFDVSGTIHLESALSISGNTTIAGQTAPGDGICLADYPVAVKGSNVIVRYMRFRLGNKHVLVDGADGWDGFGGLDHENIIIDHCSVSWSIDECCSFLGNKNTTLQWCLVAQSLVNAGHSKGNHGYGGNWGGSGASFHHNLLVHHTSRTPRLGPRPTTQLDERMDMRNNVIYNFGGNGCYGGEGMTVNIVNNYYKPGPGTPTDKKGYRIAGIGVRTNEYVTTYPAYAPALHLWGKYYVTGNYNTKYSNVNDDNWTYGVINQVDASACDGTFTAKTKDTIKLESPMPFVATTTHTAADAYERVLSYAGASLSRDSFDELMVSDTRNGKATYTGKGLSKGFVNSQNDNKPADAAADWSAWPTLSGTTAPLDSDGDGMPDAWETANGLKPDDPTDGAEVADNGYTNVENYLNSLVDDITKAQNAGGELMGDIETVGGGSSVAYEISPGTATDENWNFKDGFSVTAPGKDYATGKNSGTTFTGIKYSRNFTYTLNIPDGISIDAVEFTGYCNNGTNTGQTAYVSLLGSRNLEAGLYSFPPTEEAKTATHRIGLDTPATGEMPFRFGGDNQVVMNMTLISGTTTGIEDVTSVAPATLDNRIYTLDGRYVGNDLRTLGKGIYIVNHKKVVVR